MAARGPYAKGKAKRAEILDVALEVIAREGYSGATVKQLADAVGLSQNGLLHYFGSKDALFTEILRHRDRLAAADVDSQNDDLSNITDRLLEAVELESSAPGLAQLALRLTGEATEPDHIAHDYFRERYDVIRSVLHDTIVTLRDEGKVSADVDPTVVAALVFAAWDGLRTQWMYDKTLDIRAHLTYLLRSLGIA
ncbi:TetR/AcrR family transcriptional regulator [Agromyces laixinhei]|uniref:TetR/AcrR family transcriptional regulator n=1 Tax=Agromyces laixinhei TaxID=2585717 RepID=UPI0012EE9084|nr:TetR/AcrR family transcriptional regulator [Agromyces laixinhei]